MPSRGEGFGFVFLEAMACGLPVVASKTDGSREAVLDGKLGAMVDPDNPTEVASAIASALRSNDRTPPPGLSHFSFENFTKRLHTIVDQVLETPAATSA